MESVGTRSYCCCVACLLASSCFVCGVSCVFTHTYNRFDGGQTGRAHAMPHIKSFTRYCVAEGGARLAWVMTGSHNLSTAAWYAHTRAARMHVHGQHATMQWLSG